jgi:hypothetical protein
MKVPEGVQFNCGNCAWMQKVETPENKKKDFPVQRGFCTFEPPSVFPMPQQQSSLRNVQGQAQMGMAPFMMRPVVEATDPACGRYAPDNETLTILKAAQPEQEILCSGKGCGGKCGSK